MWWWVQFVAFAKEVCAALIKQGHWADYIDPCSGLPVRRPLGHTILCPNSHPAQAGITNGVTVTASMHSFTHLMLVVPTDADPGLPAGLQRGGGVRAPAALPDAERRMLQDPAPPALGLVLLSRHHVH
jgi:hypothetical protein